MATKTYVYEFGMGVDLHGGDMTKAACRAVFDAVRHSSLPLLNEIRDRGGEMTVNVTVGVPDPAAVDLDRVKQELPHGEITVQAVAGGLQVPGRDTILACVIIEVGGRYPD
jgi:uncharacterized protein (TIGR02058 family)